MKVVILFALFALCNCQYPGALPESTPADSYVLPSEVPADSYGPPLSDSYGPPLSDSYGAPLKSSVSQFTKAEQPKEISAAPASETLITEAVAAPAQPASFNLLTNLVAPSLLTVSESNVKAAPAVQQEAPALQELQLNIPGILPPITLPPIIPPVQVLPPALFPPPQAPAPAPAPVPAPVPVPPVPVQPVPVQPLPVQPLPVQPLPVQPLPVQPLPAQQAQPITLAVNAVPATATRLTAQFQEVPAPRFQTSFIPSQYFLSAPAPISYAPFFLRANPSPVTAFLPQQALPQLGASNLKIEPLTSIFGANSFKAGQSAVELPATRYGTPVFDALKKK